MTTPIRYRVAMSRPHSHLFEVEAIFPAQDTPLTVALPVWTPGSYLVREYSRHVQDFTVLGDDSKPLPFHRTDKRSYTITATGRAIHLHYKVYANELTVRTSHLDGTHGYFNGATLFFYAEALRGRPHHVTIDAPAGWRTTVALPEESGAFIAADYDELVDSPFEIGTHTPITFTAAGVPHEVVLWGEPQLDEKKLVTDITRIVEAEAALFGGLPFKRYVFFVYCADKGRGGLEHKASTALLYPRNGFSTARGWEDFLTLVAHEYFHCWNVKRIKPKALVPFDYAQENYTQLLWYFEGGTSYFDNLIPRRASLMSAARYLTRLGESLTALHTTPGRKVLPVTEASTIAWTKHYRPDENSGNSAISYYLKGEIVCLLLDLHLRAATNGAKSFDDLLRLLWQRYGDERGVPEDGIEAAAKELGGDGLAPFFDAALRGTGELDYSVFSTVGLELKFRPRESNSDKGGTPPRRPGKVEGWVGISPRGSGSIASVLEGSPAMAAGLYADDDVVALDGFRCDAQGLVSRVESRSPGDTVRVTIFRRDKLLELPVTITAKPADAAYFQRVDGATEDQKAAYQAWLGAPWNELDSLNPGLTKV